MVFTLQSIHSYYHIYLLLIQVASLVIQEHKGRRLAPLLKLAVVCEEYIQENLSHRASKPTCRYVLKCNVHVEALIPNSWMGLYGFFFNMLGGGVEGGWGFNLIQDFYIWLLDWVDERNGRSLGQTTNDRRHDFVRRGWRDCNCTRGLWKSKKVILTFDEFSQSNKLIWNTYCNC